MVSSAVSVVGAQDKTAGTGDWDDPSTWSPSGMPGNGDVILIPEGSVVTVRGTDHTLNDAVMIVEGKLVMESVCENALNPACLDYGSLTFTGPDSGVIVEEGGEIEDGTTLGGDSHYISTQGDTFWSGDVCVTNCGTYTGSQPFSEVTSSPSDLTNPLPVKLLYFTADADPGGTVLKWSTATEVDNSHFEIERADDRSGFRFVGKVSGAGNSTMLTSYSFVDNSLPSVGSRIRYYRIKQVDFDEQHEYSKVISLPNQMPPEREISISTSPEGFTVFLKSASAGTIVVGLTSVKGTNVFEGQYEVHYGINELTLESSSHLPGGIYLLSLSGDSFTVSKRVIKE